MKNSFLIILFSFITFHLLSQESNFVIEGIIKDSKGNPIENVNVFNSTNIGTITNSKGEFRLSASDFDKELYVSHVAYKAKGITLDRNVIKNGKLFIQITLEEKQYQLDAVNVTTDKTWQVIKPEKIWIYDFELYGENLLLLLHDSTRYELKYLDEDDNVLFQYSLNPKKVNRFITDGLGNIHIGMNDSIFQLYLENSQIEFYDGVTQDKYNKIMGSITAETDSLYLTQKLMLNNQRIIYSGINKNTKAIIPIADIFDKEGYKYSIEANRQQNRYSGVNIMGNIGLAELRRYREFYQWGKFYENVASYPIYCPLIKTQEGFCIFNSVDKKIDHYDDSGNLVKSVNSNFETEKRILSIEIDKFTNRVYSIWKKHGRIKMDEIDIQKGTIIRSFPLNNYINIEKIKIVHNNVYFLHTTKNSSKKLIRIPLQQLVSF